MSKFERSSKKNGTIGVIKSVLANNHQSILQDLEEKLSQKPRKVLILNTGGTISMFPSPKGYVTKRGQLRTYFKENPFSCDQDYTFFKAEDDFLITPLSVYNRRIWYKIIELDNLIDSSNMNPEDWIIIGTEIQNHYDDYDSFIILHGTDTMAYTASALSFMFQNLAKTVILTGSQIPVSQTRNDVFRNFLNALTIAGHFTIPEVLITFSDKLLRGNRTQKVNSSSFDSFDSPKFQPIGHFGVHIQIYWDLILPEPQVQEGLKLQTTFCKNISAIRMNPLLTYETLQEIFDNQQLQGLILETYGAGNMKTDIPFQEQIKLANERGVILINISQCYNSNVEMIYETGIIFQEMGVISGGDMTSEAALTKLSYLIGLGMNKNQIIKRMQQNLRGELTIPKAVNKQTETFLDALSTAIKSQSQDHHLIKDLVFPNILCHMCIQKKDISQIDLQHLDVKLSATDYDERTILHVACREGSLQMVEYLLLNVPEIVNNLDRWKHTPLYEAVFNRHSHIINVMIRYKAVLYAPLSELTFKLMQAVEAGDLQLLELFFQAGIKDYSQFKTIDNRTIGHLAASQQNKDVMEFLKRPGIIFDWNTKDRFGRSVQEELKQQMKKYK